MTITALFRDFLIVNKAKKNFERNLIRFNPNDKHCFLKEGVFNWSDDSLFKYIARKQCNHEVEPIMLIGQHAASFMFYWDGAPEGIKYWTHMCSKWEDYYERNRWKIKGLEHHGFDDAIFWSHPYFKHKK